MWSACDYLYFARGVARCRGICDNSGVEREKESRTDREIPFRLVKAAETTLVDQTLGGFRKAIKSGYYRTGDVLPSLHRIAADLGVSVRVPRDAIAQLAREGYVRARPRIGTVVTEKTAKAPVWRGRILYVMPAHSVTSYRFAAQARAAREVITSAGYIFERVEIGTKNGHPNTDFTPLELALSEKTSAAILDMSSPDTRMILNEAGVKYFCLGSDGKQPIADNESLIGSSREQRSYFDRFLAHCVKRGIKRVLVADYIREKGRRCPYAALFEAAGIKPEVAIIEKAASPTLGRIVESSMKYFLKRFADRRKLPELVYFTDDYFARGGLIAIAYLGIKVPEELRIVTCANRGFDPVFPVSLARLSGDPIKDGRSAAKAVIEFLRTGRRPSAEEQKSGWEYIRGDSFP